jgi:hypothetical protein
MFLFRRSYGEVRQGRIEERGIGSAAHQEGNAQERFRPQGEEPKAGDRDRAQRGARERGQGAAAEGFAEKHAQDFPQDQPQDFAEDVK